MVTLLAIAVVSVATVTCSLPEVRGQGALNDSGHCDGLRRVRIIREEATMSQAL